MVCGCGDESVADGVGVVPDLGVVRAGWAEQIQTSLQEKGIGPLDHEWLDAPLTDENGSWE